ncbi:YisL family protein [Virgibacillus sp. MG-45]|uniref:YisL family protein n=1 Tax=Virgibacillus sp. MG-45 TaxID=3102791 RepID=UPI002EDB07F3
MNTHLHVTAWVLAFILFIVTIVLRKQGKAKGAKIVQMILRLDYLLILYSGGDLLAGYFSAKGAILGEAIVKGLAGVWIIAAMEMVSMKLAKGRSTKGAWIQLIIATIITLILGFGRLPFGFLP